MHFRFNKLFGVEIKIIIGILIIFIGHLINHMKKCHAVKKEPTRIHKCSMCSCVYNSINALSRHLNIFHGVKTRNVYKRVQNKVAKSVETVDENKHSIKGKKKLYLFKGILNAFGIFYSWKFNIDP